MAGFGGTRKTPLPSPLSVRGPGTGASRAAAVPTATAERGSSAAPAQHLAGAGVRGGVGDDHPVDEFGPGGQDRGVVGGVDRLREIAPAGQGGDAVLTEVLDGGEHIGPRRQQPAVAERPEDAGVVGGGRTQVEELPFRGGDALVEELTQLVRVPVQLVGAERASGGLRTRRARGGGPPVVALGSGRRAAARCRDRGRDGLHRQAQQFGEALVGGDRLRGAALRLVRVLRRLRRVGGPCGGQFGAGLRRRRLPGEVGG